jgi:hypothetical protein
MGQLLSLWGEAGSEFFGVLACHSITSAALAIHCQHSCQTWESLKVTGLAACCASPWETFSLCDAVVPTYSMVVCWSKVDTVKPLSFLKGL